MAKTTKTTATAEATVEKVSLKERILNSTPAKVVRANWKPFGAGFGTAAGLGLITGVILKLKAGSPETTQDASYEPDTDDGCNDEVDELSTETQED